VSGRNKKEKKFEDALTPLLAALPYIFFINFTTVIIIGFLPETYLQLEEIIFLAVLAVANVFFGEFTMIFIAHCFTVKKWWLKIFSYPAGVLLMVSVVCMVTLPVGFVGCFFIHPASVKKRLKKYKSAVS
jgi:apolipoprotein N-acyltransferase